MTLSGCWSYHPRTRNYQLAKTIKIADSWNNQWRALEKALRGNHIASTLKYSRSPQQEQKQISELHNILKMKPSQTMAHFKHSSEGCFKTIAAHSAVLWNSTNLQQFVSTWVWLRPLLNSIKKLQYWCGRASLKKESLIETKQVYLTLSMLFVYQLYLRFLAF